jgi:hypothetical protein
MKDFLWRLLDWVVGALVGVVLFLLIVCDKPTAIDVYRGKTTLEITYRDSVAVDSVVVYKKLNYGK